MLAVDPHHFYQLVIATLVAGDQFIDHLQQLGNAELSMLVQPSWASCRSKSWRLLAYRDGGSDQP